MATEEQVPIHTDQEYVDELNHLLTIAKHPKTVTVLRNALSGAQLPSESAQNGATLEPGATAADQTITVQPISTMTHSKETLVYSTTKISQYGWDQSDQFVKIYISSISGLDQLSQESVSSDFKEKSVEVNLLRVKGKNYGLVISDLFSPIVPEQSSVRVKSGMVVVRLRKSRKEQWTYLTAREKKLNDAREMKPPKADKDEGDPGQGLMKLMQQMYNDGDDEMKRTIAKAWHESQDKREKEGKQL